MNKQNMERKKKWKYSRETLLCHPLSEEKYYLQMLLHIIRGLTSYEDLKLVKDISYETYKQALAALGLLDDDNE